MLQVRRRGLARIFQRGGHTGSNNVVMAFSPRYIVGCLLKKRLTKGGHGHLRTPHSYAHASRVAWMFSWRMNTRHMGGPREQTSRHSNK